MYPNLQKCAFGVTFGKLLGYAVYLRGIKVDPQKFKAVQEMSPSITEKEMRAFLQGLQYISCFISRVTMVCEPIFKKLKKGVKPQCDEECQEAFEKIKGHLYYPKLGIPLILCLTTTTTTMGPMLAQKIEGEESSLLFKQEILRT